MDQEVSLGVALKTGDDLSPLKDLEAGYQGRGASLIDLANWPGGTAERNPLQAS
jgi:hypothetical protein